MLLAQTLVIQSLLMMAQLLRLSMVVLVLMNYFASGQAAALNLVKVERAKVRDLLNRILPPGIAHALGTELFKTTNS